MINFEDFYNPLVEDLVKETEKEVEERDELEQDLKELCAYEYNLAQALRPLELYIKQLQHHYQKMLKQKKKVSAQKEQLQAKLFIKHNVNKGRQGNIRRVKSFSLLVEEMNEEQIISALESLSNLKNTKVD